MDTLGSFEVIQASSACIPHQKLPSGAFSTPAVVVVVVVVVVLNYTGTFLQLISSPVTYCIIIPLTYGTANPAWGVIFESSKIKARTSLLPRFDEKRHSSFEL